MGAVPLKKIPIDKGTGAIQSSTIFAHVLYFVCIIIIIGILIIIERNRRKWRVEVHELKADGRLHTVGFDTLVEKKIKMGTKTVYWMRKGKVEAIPPPDECVDRIKGKEEVDYLRVARDYIPTVKTMTVDYNNPVVRKKVVETYDKILDNMHSLNNEKRYDSEFIRNRFIYIPINKTLTAHMVFKPIDYDVSMMAMNEIHNADDFYQSKYEFWKKYGAIIVFAIVIVFLIILIVLTFEYMNDITEKMMGSFDAASSGFQSLADKMFGAKPPG
jgi:hypothetical protein